MKYYVYTLTDPRDGAVFYVGKGSGNRIDAHEAEARAKTFYVVNSPKCERIRAIEAAGLKVVKAKVALFVDEAPAYAYESRLIETLPNLTNGGAQFRSGFVWQRKLVYLAVKALRGELLITGEFSRALAKALTARAPAIIAKHGPYGA